jgi:prepilin-type N-terminal cleavage/methylation domain-containing protein
MQTHLLGSARHRVLRRSRRHGFTLIELMIVVVVVGVLLGYRRHAATARTAEAKQVTGGIRAAQEAYKTEKGIYAAVSSNPASYYPSATPGAFVTAWGKQCTNCVDVDAWKRLAVEPAAPVMFGYATIADVGGNAAGYGDPTGTGTTGGGAADLEQLKATDPFYITVAKGDTDGDGKPCFVTSYSTSNQLLVVSEGE